MKRILPVVVVSLVLALCGCQSPNLGPALLRSGVGVAAGFSILRYPDAAPGVKVGAEVICASAHHTNLSPAQITADLDAYGGRTKEATFILNSAINTYSLVYNSLSSTNPAVVSPYVFALCDGLNDALLLAPKPGLAKSASRNAPPNVKWPQVEYP